MRATDPNPPHPPSARRVSGNGEQHWGGVLGSLGVGFQHITEYIWGPAWSGRDGFRKRLCQHIKPRVGIGSPNRKVIKMAKILFFVGLVNIWVGVFCKKRMVYCSCVATISPYSSCANVQAANYVGGWSVCVLLGFYRALAFSLPSLPRPAL